MSNRVISLLSNSTLLNSKVVTVMVKPDPGFLATPVEIEFPHLHNVSSIINMAKRPPMELLKMFWMSHPNSFCFLCRIP